MVETIILYKYTYYIIVIWLTVKLKCNK